ncbi:MAG TPA: peroxiredoxin [Sutterella sp.]|nr:peroxiredoxin [Sutterella sp.]
MVKVGDFLTDIRANSTKGVFDISQRRGKRLVLYFYPKDNTSGCTLEARGFSAAKKAFEDLNCDIVGISRDSIKSHEGFCAKQDLSIELISDKDEALCTAFDVIRPKVMYGKPCRGIVRSTFLIDEKGVVRRVWSPVKVPGHVEEVLEAVRNLA